MSAYLVFDIDIHDRDAYAEYVKLAGPSVAQYGGRVLALTEAIEKLEGDWDPKRVVIIAFDDAGKAKAWMNSPEYGKAKPIRHRTAKASVVLVPGLK
jgi:uncharacterized protein (DUF1330 family)